jgi:6-phosphogluconolactonase (cycloisomerase 2 family)
LGGSGGSGGSSSTFAAGVGGAGQVSAARFLIGIQYPYLGPVPTKVNPDGTLTAAADNSKSSQHSQNATHAAINPSGTFLYEAAQPGIWGYLIDRNTGNIKQMPNNPIAAKQNFDSVAIDQAGKFLYAYGGGQVFAYVINAGAGDLTAVPGSPFAAAPPSQSYGPADHLAVDQTNKFLYVSTSTGVIGYTINSNTGALTMISGSPFGSTVPGPFAISVLPSNHLYESTFSSSGTTGGIYGYSIDPSTGALTAVAGSPFDTSCANADNLTAPAQTNFMYVAGCGMFSVSTSNGALTMVANDPDNSVGNQQWPVFEPSGKLIWLITQDTNCFDSCNVGVSAYDVNPSNGALTLVPNSFFVMADSFSGFISSVAITQ